MSEISAVVNPSPSGTTRSPSPAPPRRIGRDVVAALGTGLLLALCTWSLLQLREATESQRPYTILYLIPVAIGAALLGVRGGMTAALAAIMLARIYLFNDQKHGAVLFMTFPTPAEAIEFCALLLGTFTIALVTGRLRSTLSLLRASGERLRQANHNLESANLRLAETNVRLVESEEQRRDFNRDVLLAVTGGKLRLVEPDAMPPDDLVEGAPLMILPLRETTDAARLRRALEKIGQDRGMQADRLFDLCTGATEAATNAIKHGAGGDALVWAGDGAVAVQITDRGAGIAPAQLARATLEQGYSTRVSLGMGFHLMLQTADVLALATTPQGTSILLRVSTAPRPSDQEALLARYVGL